MHGRASRSTTPSEARVQRSRGRPDPKAPATPASPQANTRQPHRSEGPGRVLVGGVRAWPGFETTRRATRQRPASASVEGAGGSGGHGRASRSTTPSRRLACGDLAGGRARRRPQPSGTTSNTRRKAAAHRHTQRFGPQNKTRGSPSGPPRVHATSSYSTRSRGRAFSAVAGPRPRRPGPRSGQRPCAGCRRRRPG